MWKNDARTSLECAQQLLVENGVVLGGLLLLWTTLWCEEQLSEAADAVWLHLDTPDRV